MSNRVMHFEIHADDPERAAAFYEKVFGWEIKKWEGGVMEYWMVMTAPEGVAEPGINGGLVRRPEPLADKACGANAYVCTMVVENYDTVAEKILAAGGKVALPKFALPGFAWQGYFLDTEGNTFGVHQPDTNAA